MAPMRWAASLDMYRKVPVDLLEGTKRGSILSFMAVTVMLTLFILETRAYLKTRYVFSTYLRSLVHHLLIFISIKLAVGSRISLSTTTRRMKFESISTLPC
jgi:hypothetical protein